MKLLRSILSCLALLGAATLATAEPAGGASHDHDHAKKKSPGPNGGRLITAVEPHAEFFVLPDRTVQITFVDDAGKVVAPAAQVVTVIAGERSAPTQLKFAAKGNVLVSSAPLPAGSGFPTVVQIKSTPNAKTATEKFTFNPATCPGCQLAEYACTCGH